MTEKIRNRAGNTIARACSGGEAAPLRLRTAAGAGSNGKPFSSQGRAAARAGPPPSAHRTRLAEPEAVGSPSRAKPDLPSSARRIRRPEPEAAGSPSHARPGRRPCRVSASPAARRGRCPRGWDCRPSPAGAVARVGLGLPPVARRARLPEAEAAGSPSHAKPGCRLCRVGASPGAPRGAPDDGRHAKSGERCHILSCRYVIYANFMQHGR